MKVLMTGLTTTFLAAVMIVVANPSVAKAHPGLFCRDCPFPAKVADGRWVMPNGKIQIDIDETPYGHGMNQVHVTLREAKSGAVVAAGVTYQPKNRRNLTVDLMDRQGREIKGFVRYVDGNRETIQAKFTCEECNIAPMLD